MEENSLKEEIFILAHSSVFSVHVQMAPWLWVSGKAECMAVGAFGREGFLSCNQEEKKRRKGLGIRYTPSRPGPHYPTSSK
jgi:hypothetical protein